MKKSLLMLTGFLLIFLAINSGTFAQKYTVKGQIIDETGLAMAGASVVEKGSVSNGVVADMDGRFAITVSSPQSEITISTIGYKTITLTASSPVFEKPLKMEQNAVNIDDIVVIGYGTVKKNDATGSVIAVKVDDANRGAVTSAQEMLQGKVPGVHILNGDGSPGSGARIRVRGGSSLNASNEPLLVIDNVPIAADAAPGMRNSLNTINPADIESFTVLKDASATAIYGSRASNGVIIITTKKGKGNKMKVSYNGSFGVSVLNERLYVLNGDQMRELLPKLSNYEVIKNLLGNANTNWQDLIFRTALSNDHNVSIFGNANDKLPYRTSIGYTNEQGTIKKSNFDRFTGSFGLAPSFFDDHLTVNLNAKGVYNKNKFVNGREIVDNASFFDPTQEPYFADNIANGYWNWLTKSGNTYIANKLANTNPLSLIYDTKDENTVKRFIGNAKFDYKVHGFEDLNLNLNVGTDIAKTTGESTGGRPGSFQSMKSSTVILDDGTNKDVKNIGTYNKYENFRRNQLLEFYANYKKEIGVHQFDIMAGYSWQRFYTANTNNSFVNTTNERLMNKNPLWRTEYYLLSFFGRFNYNLMDKYLFTATVRKDGSSRFDKGNRWGLFPSLAFAWNLKKEDFLKDVKFVNTLKLRLGWGKTGQQEISQGDYPYLARYNLSSTVGTSYNMGGSKFYYFLMPNAYDPNIKWESTATYNVGFDFGFFDNFLTGNIDYYFRKTSDLLNTVSTAMGANFSNTVITNIGNMENQGLEISLNFNPINRNDLKVDFGISGTFQKSKITKLQQNNDPNYKATMGSLNAGTGGYSQVHKVGSSPYTFYLWKQIYDDHRKPVQNALADRNKDGKITEADRYLTNKNAEPDFYYGINAKIVYKKWDLGFNAHGSFGNYLLNDFRASHADALLPSSQGYLKNLSKYTADLGFYQSSDNAQIYSDMFLENASFLKIDDINVGYTFSNVFKQRTTMRVAAGVQNVCTFTKYKGLDPEISGGNGIDHTIWARPRIFTIRLSINF